MDGVPSNEERITNLFLISRKVEIKHNLDYKGCWCTITLIQKQCINSNFQFIYIRILFSFHLWACGSMDSSYVGAPAARNPHCETSGRKYTQKENMSLDSIWEKITVGTGIQGFCKQCTLKQVGHMVMLILGIRERKYSHWSGRGQRLIRTSLLLIKRSTERLTLTGTKSDPPCCLDRQWSTLSLTAVLGDLPAPHI